MTEEEYKKWCEKLAKARQEYCKGIAKWQAKLRAFDRQYPNLCKHWRFCPNWKTHTTEECIITHERALVGLEVWD
jgi:hypothetical protein